MNQKTATEARLFVCVSQTQSKPLKQMHKKSGKDVQDNHLDETIKKIISELNRRAFKRICVCVCV